MAARRRRDARDRTKLRAGTPAQTAPDTTRISNVTGTSPSSSTSRGSRAEPFLPATAVNFRNNVTLLQLGQRRFLWCVAKKGPAEGDGFTRRDRARGGRRFPR